MAGVDAEAEAMGDVAPLRAYAANDRARPSAPCSNARANGSV